MDIDMDTSEGSDDNRSAGEVSSASAVTRAGEDHEIIQTRGTRSGRVYKS
jgi:hypothetical protein